MSGSASDSRARGPGFDTRSGHILSPSAGSRRAVVSYWRKYVHEVLVNRLGGLSLPRKRVVRLTDCPDMTFAVYRGRKTPTKQQQRTINNDCVTNYYFVTYTNNLYGISRYGLINMYRKTLHTCSVGS